MKKSVIARRVADQIGLSQSAAGNAVDADEHQRFLEAARLAPRPAD